MDLTSLFYSLPPWLQAGLLLFLLISWVLSHCVSNTVTPPPNTPFGRFYAALEFVAGIYGRAKMVGVPVPDAAVIMRNLSDVLSHAAAAGQPVDPAALAGAIGVQLRTPAPAGGVPESKPAAAAAGVASLTDGLAHTVGQLVVAMALLLFAVGGLSACAGLPTTQSQTVAELDSTYQALAAAEGAYAKSNLARKDVAEQMVVYDQAAYDALSSANKAAQNGDSATTAAAVSTAQTAIDLWKQYLIDNGALPKGASK